MKPNSLEDRGFRRKAKAVNSRKTHRKTVWRNIFYNCGQIPKPLCVMAGKTCAHFRMVNNMRIKRNCKIKRYIIRNWWQIIRFTPNNNICEPTKPITTDWKSIKWNKVNRHVTSLQRRIYRASRNNDRKKKLEIYKDN